MNDDDMNVNNRHDDLQNVIDSASDAQEEAALDALLARFGADYNRPPDIVPREEMWHEIQRSDVPRHFVQRHPAWSVLAAAVLLLGVGISIGVEVNSRLSQDVPRSERTAPQLAVTAPDSEIESTQAVGGAEVPRTASSPSQAQRPTNSANAYASNGAVVAEPNGAAIGPAYTLATVRHFAAVEALLTSYSTSPRDAAADAQLASWSRALLSQTRLLLDSPAASDPIRNKLLQDLEQVLVQMTQLSPADSPIDREMINGAVQHSDVITRLRTAVPAGAATSL